MPSAYKPLWAVTLHYWSHKPYSAKSGPNATCILGPDNHDIPNNRLPFVSLHGGSSKTCIEEGMCLQRTGRKSLLSPPLVNRIKEAWCQDHSPHRVSVLNKSGYVMVWKLDTWWHLTQFCAIQEFPKNYAEDRPAIYNATPDCDDNFSTSPMAANSCSLGDCLGSGPWYSQHRALLHWRTMPLSRLVSLVEWVCL